ncbi:hypothetical protein M0804_004561 [Polistes exclamans]|nr:hypothetical protein M0804_004561 [Polistes exclamans]
MVWYGMVWYDCHAYGTTMSRVVAGEQLWRDAIVTDVLGEVRHVLRPSCRLPLYLHPPKSFGKVEYFGRGRKRYT